MAHMRQINVKEHHQASGRRTRFNCRNKMCTDRGRQLVVGLGGWFKMPLLDMTRRIQKYSERQTSTLVHWRGAWICNITAKIQESEQRCEVRYDVTTSQTRVQVDVRRNELMTYIELGKKLGVPGVRKRIITFNLCQGVHTSQSWIFGRSQNFFVCAYPH